MKLPVALCAIVFAASAAKAQTITNADGSLLTTTYCYADKAYQIIGQPSGGTFSGCGLKLVNGQWYFNPADATAGITVFPFQCAVNYTVNNHTISRNILIQKPVKPNPPLQNTQTCDGNFTLAAHMLYAGAYKYRWEPAAYLSAPGANVTQGSIDETRTFVLTTTDQSSNCTGSDTITVFKRPHPEVSVTPAEQTILAREQVQLQASGAGYYTWPGSRWLNNDRIADPVASPRTTYTYTVVGANEYGCTDTATATVTVQDRLFVPSAFSPNGDGRNDLFRIENFGYQKIEAFRVFNRWGQLVFETQNGLQGWDGTSKGKQADAATYYYLIEVRTEDNELKMFRGDVTLVR